MGLDRELRVCPHCKHDVIETEFHFLIVCPLYRDLRSTYFDFVNPWIENEATFIKLLTSDNVTQVRRLCKFLLHADERRNIFVSNLE